MPLLGGLFSKKNKSTTRLKGDDYASTTATSSNVSSPTISSYISPDSSVPSYPNAQNGFNGDHGQGAYPKHLQAPLMSNTSSSSSSAGNSKLRFFGRKKSSQKAAELAAQSAPDFQSMAYSTPPRLAHQTRATSSETDPSDLRRLRPPPSRSAIFAAYADPVSALSTRSLPNDNSFASDSSLLPPSPTPVSAPAKRPSLFAWGSKPSPVSSPRSPPGDSSFMSTDSLDSPADGSFNLKSFRHVQPPSPSSQPPNPSNASLAAPIPRPRGASVHSDASQRISVAAFREAQARRSQAGSPSPSNRGVSPVPALPSRSMTPEGSRGPLPSRSTTSIPQSAQRRRSSMAVTSTTDDSDSSEEEESEDESLYRGGRRRQPSGKVKAKSELGHGYAVESSFKRSDPPPPLPTRGPRSHSGHSAASNSRPRTQYEIEDDSDKQPMPPRSQSTLGHYDSPKERASTSIGSVIPSASAQKAVTANSTAPFDRKVTPTQATYSQQTTRGRAGIYPAPTDSDSGSDSDDAPLARLIAPKRPGSAMSSHSNPSLRSAGQSSGRSPNPPKPLIDITELTRGPIPTRAVTSPPKSDAGFTKGSTLLSQGNPIPFTSSPLVDSPTSEHHPPLTQKVPPPNFVSPPSTPAKELKEFFPPPMQSSVDKAAKVPPAPLRDPSQEQKKDIFSDRLARVVKKSLTSPVPTTITASPSSLPPSPPVSTPVSRDVSPFPGGLSDSSQPRLKTEPSRAALPRNPPPVIRRSESPADEDLAQLLGMGGIKFISRAGEEPDSTSSESESESENSDDSDKNNANRIAPIPIKQRSTPPAFAVMSRPSFPRQQSNGSSEITSPEVEKKSLSPQFAPRQRSSTLSVSPSATSFPSTRPSDSSLATTHTSGRSVSSQLMSSGSSSLSPLSTSPSSGRPTIGGRQRSSTMISPVSPSKIPAQVSSLPPQPIKPFQLPERPFISARRDSPASSTGDSSSGRTPYTPADGSDLGLQDDKKSRLKQDQWSGGASGLGIKRHTPNRRSVSFEDEPPLKPPTKSHIREGARNGSEGVDSNDEREQRRRERRRSEAKAAIELGKVINGPGPVLDDDGDDLLLNQPMNSRMSTFNPMMPMGGPMAMPVGFPGSGWGGNMAQSMLSPAQFMMPPPADPNMFAAHQQAMLYAKQAYQMAVAQQAMAAAGDEWERGSNVGGYGGGGSVYGGSNAPSMMSSPYGMMGGMMQPNWGGGSAYGGQTARYSTALNSGGMVNSSMSEYGGGSRQSGNWASSRSVYGESFGPSNDKAGRRSGQSNSRPSSQMWGSPRDSGYFPPVPPMPASQNNNGRGSPDPKGGQRSRTTSQPSLKGGPQARRPQPPSSWKASGV
ncbi:hypothetical protein CPB83DRAFT_888376 [Crepidotus variabilis]|uniref:Uncharacterized protein n=1 Tax=Crepidotus variabilis TaxID=179855 RepID=A0A9P6EV66_9AGAR|nr:hypothetical protein CPB83DRAFT_888376 [Crepidotus variabilis]